jgi:hypothetical protein
LTGVGKLSVDGVDDGSEQNTVLESDVEEHGGMVLINGGVDHLGDADGGRNSSESLEEAAKSRQRTEWRLVESGD